jgi:hypothetical protein
LYLSQIDEKVKNLSTDFSTGEKLKTFLVLISGKKVPGKFASNPTFKLIKFANLQLILDFLKTEEVDTYHTKVEDLEKGDLKTVNLLMENIVTHYHLLKGKSSGSTKNISAMKKTLLNWVQEKTISTYSVNNFTTDFQDGKALQIIYSKLSSKELLEDKTVSIQHILDDFQKEFNIPSIFSPENIANGGEEVSMLMYLTYLKDFEETQQKFQLIVDQKLLEEAPVPSTPRNKEIKTPRYFEPETKHQPEWAKKKLKKMDTIDVKSPIVEIKSPVNDMKSPRIISENKSPRIPPIIKSPIKEDIKLSGTIIESKTTENHDDLKMKLIELQKNLEEKEKIIHETQKKLKDQEKKINDEQKELKEQEESIAKKKKLLNHQEEEISTKQKKLKEEEEKISQKESKLNEQLQHVEKELEIKKSEQSHPIKDDMNLLNGMEEEISEKQKKLENLEKLIITEQKNLDQLKKRNEEEFEKQEAMKQESLKQEVKTIQEVKQETIQKLPEIKQEVNKEKKQETIEEVKDTKVDSTNELDNNLQEKIQRMINIIESYKSFIPKEKWRDYNLTEEEEQISHIQRAVRRKIQTRDFTGLRKNFSTFT